MERVQPEERLVNWAHDLVRSAAVPSRSGSGYTEVLRLRTAALRFMGSLQARFGAHRDHELRSRRGNEAGFVGGESFRLVTSAATTRRFMGRQFGLRTAPLAIASTIETVTGKCSFSFNSKIPVLVSLARFVSRRSLCALSIGLLLVASICLFTGCRSAVMLAPVNLTEPGWRVRNGQALWRPQRRAPELAGDLMVASHPDGRSVVQFTKTPIPIVVAQTSARAWHIEFVPEKRELSGKTPAPVRFVWLYLARILFAGQEPPAHWTVQWLEEGRRWRVENRRTGETLEGYLKP